MISTPQELRQTGLSPQFFGDYQAGALVPFMDTSKVASQQNPFNAADYGVTLGEGVTPQQMFGGYGFTRDGVRTDYQGNPFTRSQDYSRYGTPFQQKDLFGNSASISPSTGQFDLSGAQSQAAQSFLQQEAQNIANQRGISVQDAMPAALAELNLFSGRPDVNKSNSDASNSYIQSHKKDRGFGSFLKNFVSGPALLPLTIAGSALLAPAIAGAFTAPAATGVAAGSGAGLSGGLGSSILAGFSTPQALAGAVTGGLGGLASGGDLSSALKGAAFGGLGGGFGSSIGGSLGLGQVGQQAFTGALTGASGGLGAGNLKDAGLGAILGGAGGYLQGGGQIPGLGSFDQQLPPDVFGPAKPGTGLLGGAQDLFQTANTGLTIGGQPMKLGSLLSAGGDIYGYMQGKDDIDEISRLYQQAQQQASAQLNPYAQAGQTALANLQAPSLEALQNDPGYQFRLQQGNQALERSLAAQGMGQSGAALKAAQEYGQGLADQTYNDYFNRQMGLANQGFGAASGLGSIIGQGAQGQAAAQAAQIGNRNQALSNIFGGGYDDEGNILQGSLSRLLGGLF
jgi:hypothetical protein